MKRTYNPDKTKCRTRYRSLKRDPNLFVYVRHDTHDENGECVYLDLELCVRGVVKKVSLGHDELDPHAQA